MHAEYYTLNGNHIKEEIVYFQKMSLAVDNANSCWQMTEVTDGPIICFFKGIVVFENWYYVSRLNSDGHFPFKITLLIQSVKGMHISFASERKTFVGIVPLVDLF